MLAIIIPFYKLTFFEATLQSLADQTDKRFKVYIGDDASPEECSPLLKQFDGQFDFVYNRFETNIGATSLTQQWERCITLSNNEEWLMILGDDDVLSSNFVEEFHLNYQKIDNNFNVIRFGVVKINEEGEAFSDLYKNPIIENSKEILFSKKRSSLSEYVFRKQQVISIGFKNFPLAWWSDVLAVLEFSNFSDIYSVNEAFVNVRISKYSISGSRENFNLKSLATFQFNDYLISKRRHFFSKNERKIIIINFSKCYINDKRKINYFCKISMIYIKELCIREYLEFLNDIRKSYFLK